MLKITALAAALAGSFAAVAADSPVNGQSAITGEAPKMFVAGQTEAPMELQDLMSDKIKGSKLDKVGDIPLIRAEAIKEAAASLGARDGMAKMLHDLATVIEKKHGRTLDAQFDFVKLALSVPVEPGKPMDPANPYAGNGEFGMILPPVILEGRDADSFPNEDEMRISDKIYKIHAKARLVPVDKQTSRPVVPNWRDYLIFTFPEIQLPHESLLPRNAQEKALWDEWVKKGWLDGQKQAQTMFKDGFARLKRDYNGMLNYKLAYVEGKVTRPMVAGVKMGVTGGASEMRINDRVVRITDHSSFVTDPAKWTGGAETK